MKKINTLLTCAGRRHYLARYFHNELKGRGKVIGTDMDLTAPALVACDYAVQVPAVNAPDYMDVLMKTIERHEVDLVFSLNDLELELLSKKRDLIHERTGALVYVPTLESLQVCIDKWATFQFAQRMGIVAPQTWLSVDEALLAIEQSKGQFPLMVKPRWGSASIGLFKVNNADELKAAFSACADAVASSLLASFGSQKAVLIQELIEGDEYGVDILYDKEESFIGFTAKKKLAMRAGETDKAVTVPSEVLKEIVHTIAQNLPHRGNMDCDFIERDGQFYLLELNPRFGGGYPFTHLAGANHVKMLLDDYLNDPIDDYFYEVGKAFAKCDSLVHVPY